MTQRYKVTIAYDGTDFHGWQAQEPPDREPLRTVQGTIEDALLRTIKQPARVRGASRTDTGVHALGQVAHFDADTPIPLHRLPSAINSRLPDDIEIRDIQVVPPHFDAVFDAVEKQYRYRIWPHEERPLQIRHTVYHYWRPLDVDLMNTAARKLMGEHDFAAFATVGHNRQSTVRTILNCAVHAVPSQSQMNRDEIHIVIRGNGFLYNMIRIIGGTLIEIGRGYWPPDYIDNLLKNPDRQLAGPTIPPQGLCLEWIQHRPMDEIEKHPHPFISSQIETTQTPSSSDLPPAT